MSNTNFSPTHWNLRMIPAQLLTFRERSDIERAMTPDFIGATALAGMHKVDKTYVLVLRNAKGEYLHVRTYNSEMTD